MIPITSVDVHDSELLVLEVLKSGMLAQGPMVKRFEDEFAQLCGVRHAIAVNNGTTALVAALQVLGLEAGDEVITSPFTFVATLNAILEAGATARFADIRDEDFNLDPEGVAAVVGDRVRVLMPVHLYGQSADMAALLPIARQHGLRVVEDSAQAHGARQFATTTGAFGDLGCFSFYATKNLATGEGGMVTTNDDELADKLRVLRNQGMRQRYEYVMAGHNYRMTDLQAAVAIPQLERYDRNVAARQHNANRLTEGLRDVPGLVTPQELPGRRHVWHQYTVVLTDESPVRRDELADALTARGVGCGVYYPRLVFDYDCYRHHPRVITDDVPVAARIAATVLSLPVHPALSESQLDVVISAVRSEMGV